MRPVGVVSKKLNGARRMECSKLLCIVVEARTPKPTRAKVRKKANTAAPTPASAYSIM